MMDEIIWKDQREDVHDVATNRIEFPKLETLELWDLPSLVGFCRWIDEIDFPQLEKLVLGRLQQINLLFYENNMPSNSEQNNNVDFCSLFTRKVSFPSLEELTLEELPNVSHIWSNELPIMSSFAKLEKLEVKDCDSLRNYMFHPSMARVLVNLQTLSIWSCSKMEAVVGLEEEREEGKGSKMVKTLFPQLRDLQLINLPNLRRFCHFTHSLELPLLAMMHILNCPNMEALSVGHMSPPKLSLKDISSSGDHNNAVPLLEEVTFPSLEELKLEGLDNVSHIWRSELPIMSSFAKLKTLEVNDCGSLKNLFQLPVWKEQREDVHNVATNRIEFPKLGYLSLEIDEIDFSQLKVLVLSKLPQMNSLFHENNNVGFRSFFPQKVKFPSLKDLVLYQLPNVSHVWSKELPIMSSFAKLKYLRVYDCGSLSNMFHPSMARVLVNLQRLSIENCSKMEAVVGLEEEVEEGQGSKIVKTLFPQLTYLELKNLPNLRRFCHFTHSLELPLLTDIEIRACPHMEAFSVGHVSAPKLSLADVSWIGDLNNDLQLLKEESRKKEEEEEKQLGWYREEENRIMEQEERRKEESAKRMTTTENQEEILRKEEVGVEGAEEEESGKRRGMTPTENQEEDIEKGGGECKRKGEEGREEDEDNKESSGTGERQCELLEEDGDDKESRGNIEHGGAEEEEEEEEVQQWRRRRATEIQEL